MRICLVLVAVFVRNLVWAQVDGEGFIIIFCFAVFIKYSKPMKIVKIVKRK